MEAMPDYKVIEYPHFYLDENFNPDDKSLESRDNRLSRLGKRVPYVAPDRRIVGNDHYPTEGAVDTGQGA